MIAPLTPADTETALLRGTQAELDEFHRLVEKSHLEQLEPQKFNDGDKARLSELRDKLFPLARRERGGGEGDENAFNR